MVMSAYVRDWGGLEDREEKEERTDVQILSV